MSKIIKASQITGEYRLEENNYLKKKNENLQRESDLDLDGGDQLTEEKQEAVDSIIKEAERKAARIVEEAEKKAAEIKNGLDDEILDTKQQAYEDGYKEGFEKGSLEGEKKTLDELKILLESFDNIIKKSVGELNEDIEELQGDLISIAVQIAGKIAAAEIEFKPELINEIVFDMIKDMTDVEEITVYIRENLLQYINKLEFESNFMHQKIEFVADNNLRDGDCIVETHFGGKDGTLENKLYLLEKELLKGAGFDEEN